MAIEPVNIAGHFIPNKDGYPAVLSEEPKSQAQKAAELTSENVAFEGTLAVDAGSGGAVDLTA